MGVLGSRPWDAAPPRVPGLSVPSLSALYRLARWDSGPPSPLAWSAHFAECDPQAKPVPLACDCEAGSEATAVPCPSHVCEVQNRNRGGLTQMGQGPVVSCLQRVPRAASIYPFTVPQARSVRSGPAPSETCAGGCFLASFSFRWVPGLGRRHPLLPPSSRGPALCLRVSPCLCLWNTSMAFGSTLVHDLISQSGHSLSFQVDMNLGDPVQCTPPCKWPSCETPEVERGTEG